MSLTNRETNGSNVEKRKISCNDISQVLLFVIHEASLHLELCDISNREKVKEKKNAAKIFNFTSIRCRVW